MRTLFLLILFLGLLLRLLLVGNTGFIADISFWKSWSLAAIDHGIVWTAFNTNINYPPGFIYILWLMGKIYTLFGDPHDYNNFWRENNFGFLLASKSIAIISDIIIAILIYWFFQQREKFGMFDAKIPSLKTQNSKLNLKTQNIKSSFLNPQLTSHNYLPLLLSSLFFLNPVVIIDSALWGQVESFGILFTIIAIILLFYRRPFLSTCIFTVGTLMKLQNIIYIPIFFLFISRYFNLKTMLKSLGVATATFFLVNLPFLITKNMHQVLYLLTVNSDYFPWLSLNAHNLWLIVAKGAGMQVTDKITVLGILNAKTVGLLLFSSSYILPMILVFKKPTASNFLFALTFAIFSFFLLTTQSHERYSYPVVVLLLLLYPFLKRSDLALTQGLTSKRFFWPLYTLFTLTIFFNIHTGLILNYPQNGIPILTQITSKPLIIASSYFHIFLYLLLIPFFFGEISPLFLAIPLIFFASFVSFLHLPYNLKGQVSLTFFKPIINKQDYGTLQIDKSVDSQAGWKKWNRLSVNYLFYRKGFGTHANSNLVFDIDRKFSLFTTDFGVDTEAPTYASVVFEIWGDGVKLFESEKKGRFDFPGQAKVDVSNVKHLGLVVNDAGDGISSDHADWLNPVLYR